MEELLKEWQIKFDKLYNDLHDAEGYTDKDWQNDGRLTELNNCMVSLRRLIDEKDINKSKHCNYEHPPFDPEKCEKYIGSCLGCVHHCK
jgi:hypothetical protein